MIYIPIIAGFISFILFVAKCKDERSVKGVFLKNMTSIFFVLTAAAGIFINPDQWKFGLFIILGLVFGMLGDIYLDQKWVYPDDMALYLNAGFISFALGHILYIPAVMKAAEFSTKLMLIPVAAGIIVAIGNLLLEKPMKQNFGKFKAIVTVYSFILAAMCATAVTAAVVTKQAAFIVFAVGSVLFLISDLILSPMYFGKGKNTPLNFILNHTTYYLGQYLIAFSVSILPAATSFTVISE